MAGGSERAATVGECFMHFFVVSLSLSVLLTKVKSIEYDRVEYLYGLNDDDERMRHCYDMNTS